MGNNKKRLHIPFGVKICAAACAVAVLLFPQGELPSRVAVADTQSVIDQLEAKAEQIKKENQQREQQIKNLNGDISSNKQAMQTVSDQFDGVKAEIQAYSELVTAKMQNIDEKAAEIEAVELTILDKEKTIEEKKAQIKELEAQNKDNLAKFAKLARAMYMNDSSGVMPVLNGSDDWYSYFVYSDVVRNISGQNAEFMQRLQNSIDHQKTLISELNASIDNLEIEKADLQAQKAEYEQQKADLEQEIADLEVRADEQLTYLNTLAAKNSSLQSQVNGIKTKIEAANKELDTLNTEIEEIIRLAQEDNNSSVAYSTSYRWPVSAKFQNITCYFGYDAWRGSTHYGIDISSGGIAGTDIHAAQSGTVIKVNNNCTHNYGKSYYQYSTQCGHGGGYGNYVIIDHGNGMSTLYAHCQSINVKQGQTVTKGDVIGAVGTTGWSTGYHLHFEVRVNGKAVNPLNYKPYTMIY